VPDFAPAWTGLGDVALLQGKLAPALDHYATALNVLDTYGTTYDRDAAALLAPVLHTGRALAYRGLENEEAATAEIAVAAELVQALLDSTPQWPAARFARGTVLAVAGDRTAAATEFDAAIACDVKYRAARDRFLERLGRLP
jgi:tetratricopeptide (TPR) repeat protein